MTVGAPKGSTNRADGCRLKDALTKRLAKKEQADRIIEALVEKAESGDVSAIKEVFDRSGGKATQTIIADVTAHEVSLSDLE